MTLRLIVSRILAATEALLAAQSQASERLGQRLA
jgi:hypothetical protein